MKERLLLVVLTGLLLMSCGQDTPEQEAPVSTPLPSGDTIEKKRYPLVTLSVPVFQIREAPRVDSRSLGDLGKGERIALLGPVSEEVTRLTFGKKTFFQPWLLVRTSSGVEGWVHAAALGDDMPDGLRLKALLGQDLAEMAATYYQAFEEMESAASVILAIRQAHQVADALTIALQVQPSEMAPEVAELLPALTTIWLAPTYSWHFFVDYTAFTAAAQHSDSPADDKLLELYYRTYPVDSIGYVHPAWKLEVEEGKVYSLLGKGMHRAYLGHLDQMQRYRDIAGWEIDQLKALIINDMATPSVLYWEAREKVQAELEVILDTTFAVLTPRDTLALYKSLQLLKDTSAAEERRFNFRAGF
jgi:hypothetical protein